MRVRVRVRVRPIFQGLAQRRLAPPLSAHLGALLVASPLHDEKVRVVRLEPDGFRARLEGPVFLCPLALRTWLGLGIALGSELGLGLGLGFGLGLGLGLGSGLGREG